MRLMDVLRLSNRREIVSVLEVYCKFAEGMAVLQAGDAHRVASCLKECSNEIDRLRQLDPGFALESYSIKVAYLAAVTNTCLNMADISSAGREMGELRAVHDELLDLLDRGDADHVPAFLEIYGTRVEMSFAFIFSSDIPSFDLVRWRHRLEEIERDVEELSQLLEVALKNQITTLVSVYPALYECLGTLNSSLETLSTPKKQFTTGEIEALAGVGRTLHSVEQDVLKTAGRGNPLLFNLGRLKQLQRNILVAGRDAVRGFDKISGAIAYCAFVGVLVLIFFTGGVEDESGLYYFGGVLFISLVAGFGLQALKWFRLLMPLPKQSRGRAMALNS